MLRHLWAVMEGTTDCVFFLDRQWRFVFLNGRAAAELRGGNDLIGVNLWDAFPETAATVFGEFYRKAMAERSTQVFEAYYPPLETWFEVHAVPIDDGLTVFFRNINERVAATEALRERELQLETVFGQTMVGIIHRRLDGRVLMVNQRWCDLVGRTREELDSLPIFAPTYHEDALWNVPLFDQHLRTGEPFQVEKRFVHPDGSLVWVAVNVSFVKNEAGEVVSMIAVAEDIGARKAAEEEIRESRNLFQVVIDSVQDLIFVKDREGRFVLTNRQMREACGPLEGQRVGDCFPQELADDSDRTDHQVLTSGSISIVEEKVPIRGELRAFQTVKVPWRQDGEVIGVIGVSRDLTERLDAEQELQESRRQLTTLIDNLPGLVYRSALAPPWPFSFMSEGAEALTGYTTAELMQREFSWADVVHGDDCKRLQKSIEQAIRERRPFNEVYRIITRTGGTRWVMERGQCIYNADGSPAFLEGFISDVTQQRQTEERLRWVAHHDSLTGVPNRALFQERLDVTLKEAKRTGRKVGLLLLDLDHLKEVNDTLGHDAGDTLLQVAAERLSSSIRSIDTVARNGGDEFAIILPEIDSEQDIWTLVRPVLERLQEPFSYAGRTLDCRASIGASLCPDHGDDATELLKRADVALYTAKAAGRGRIMIFRPAMQSKAELRMQMRINAREAVRERRIEPFYQPKVLLRSGEIAGFEALLRWHNPLTGIETPASIKAAFDDPRLAVAMGQHMHELVFDDMRRWLDAGMEIGHVAINASAAEFRGNDFAEEILERLRATGIPTRYLELEVTETVFLGRGAEHVGQALRTLSLEGVRIALDDFGTGYASLSHLKQFPVDIIKIDRSFVQDLADNLDDTAILQAVLNLGRGLGITTVAEGVETELQATYLRAQGCDIGQGYLFGKAVPRSEIPKLYSSWEPHRCCR
ncbi:EAL domain-containing protein [Microvirga lenta]|uniref:EAL domain-containing protein n=1 Tax=Microvirga lenta TaxID=2881337 RepID=UPI001CFFD30B|nr:EAL domain-containing protein [Microvirga lenta]MCB5175505.1 EAL domain-containing protein [Microvirga lenta]